MSSALPTSSTGHSLSLGVLDCPPSIAPQHVALELSTGRTEEFASKEPASQIAVVEETRTQTLLQTPEPVVVQSQPAKPLSPTPKHRIARVREQQGVSQRTMARRLGIDVKSLQRLEQPESDVSLSQLLAVQQALEVPLIDLLEDGNELSRPIAERAKMVKVMKTAVALREAKGSPRTARLATMLCEQLVDVMPELAEVSGWPQFGSRRGPSALGKALAQPIDTSDIRLPD